MKSLCAAIFLLLAVPAMVAPAMADVRVPAEWEPQAATWLQWPGPWERAYEPAFAKMSAIIARYQTLHILANSDTIEKRARQAISESGGDPGHDNITWHRVDYDSAWMRDNGPVYVIEDGKPRIQNWEFDAWGGGFGNDIPYADDNRIPDYVGAWLDWPVDKVDIVHERGNLEFNGDDTVLLNWSTLGDPERNPGYTLEAAETDLKRLFGVSRVVFIEGILEGDRTRGHIDGIARFIDAQTVVVPQCTDASLCQPGSGGDDQVYDDAARVIADAGFRVLRFPIEGFVSYRGTTFDTDYMNWIVGNGFVIAVGFGDPELDESARQRIQSYFPDRDVHIVEMLSSWHAGGGAHCHTNDQPLVGG